MRIEVFMNCEKISRLVKKFSLIRQCDRLKNGTLRMATVFQYPNGGFIDVFLADSSDFASKYVLCDAGQTYNYLLDMNITWKGMKRKKIIDDVCCALKVQEINGEFVVPLATMENIPDGIIKLVQCSIRVVDIVYLTNYYSKRR